MNSAKGYLRGSPFFCNFDFVGDSDKLILGHKDQRIQKYFVDIYGAFSDPSAELNNKIIIKVATLALKCVTIVYFSKFMKASAETKGNQLISEKATKKLYHCVKLTLWILRLHVQNTISRAGVMGVSGYGII